MFKFNLEQTANFQALRWERFPLFKFASFFKTLFFPLFIFSLFFVGISFFGFFPLGLAVKSSILFLIIFIFFGEISLFLNLKIKNPELKTNLSQILSNPQDYNLAEVLNFETAKIVWEAIKLCKKRKISEIPSTVLFYSSLKGSPKIELIFFRLGVVSTNLLEKTKNYLEKLEKKQKFVPSFSLDFQNTIIEAAKIADERGRKKVGESELLVAISKIDPFFKEVLVEENLKEKDIADITLWLDSLEERLLRVKKFWTYENLAKHGSVGKDWSSGYTVTLDQFGIDWRDVVSKYVFKEVIGHEKEIKETEIILAKTQLRNVLLVGEAGVGRKSIIEALAQRCYLGTSIPELNNKRVVELDMIALLSQISDPEMVEATLDKIFQEVVTAGNVILVIDEIHNFIEVKTQKVGAADISGVLSKYLLSPHFPFIGISTYEGLHRKIEQNASLVELFRKVEVSEISESETIRILKNLALELEQKYKVLVIFPTIREIINLTSRYMPNLQFPKKAIDILEETMVYVTTLKEKVVLPHHVAKIISNKIQIPVEGAGEKEKEKLLNLENLIHQRIVNQEEAVKEVSIAMRRARAGIASKKRPMGTFLFLGPTGVGKTETSKALAAIYFGAEEKMIRLDMSEFQAIVDIPRLIGGSGLSEEPGLLTTPVKETPFSLVLLDEIEKAHPNILNLFLQVFDEGHITDGQGRKVMFTNTIIICTSNAGAERIWEQVERNEKIDKDKFLDYLFKKGTFRPEFINRFDAVVIFRPLTKENLLDIAQIMLSSLAKNLKEKEIEFIITEPLKEKIVGLSYKPAFGAREMRRVIQNKVENVIAQALLSDKIKKGDKIEITAKDFKIKKI